MEILNTYTIYNELLTILPMLPLVTCIAYFLKVIVNCFMKEWKTALISLLICAVSFGILYGLAEWWGTTETKRYEVVITDYNKIDFNQYKIIETRGKIVVLEEIKRQ